MRQTLSRWVNSLGLCEPMEDCCDTFQQSPTTLLAMVLALDAAARGPGEPNRNSSSARASSRSDVQRLIALLRLRSPSPRHAAFAVSDEEFRLKANCSLSVLFEIFYREYSLLAFPLWF